MVIDASGVQTVTLNLMCGPNKDTAELPLTEVLDILASARTFEDIRREYFTRATLKETRNGVLRVTRRQ